ncbi:MAG: SsrA-binding protein SmpB [Candidatus Omnitrophica bacterium]|nr:SsrA-binding protein SmpB [Candidatus Omnitrophota bacterium]
MMKIVATNRKAHRDYHVLETVECGIELRGTEVKSLRENGANLKDGFARVEKDEVFLYNIHISPYAYGNIHNHEPERVRRLLLKRGQIRTLKEKVGQKGFTLVPLTLYFKRGYAKIELGIVRGKRTYDKRETIRKKETQREIDRALRQRQKGL